MVLHCQLTVFIYSYMMGSFVRSNYCSGCEKKVERFYISFQKHALRWAYWSTFEIYVSKFYQYPFVYIGRDTQQCYHKKYNFLWYSILIGYSMLPRLEIIHCRLNQSTKVGTAYQTTNFNKYMTMYLQWLATLLYRTSIFTHAL